MPKAEKEDTFILSLQKHSETTHKIVRRLLLPFFFTYFAPPDFGDPGLKIKRENGN